MLQKDVLLSRSAKCFLKHACWHNVRIVQDAVDSGNPSANPFDDAPSNRDSSSNPFDEPSGKVFAIGSDSLVAKEYDAADSSSDRDDGPSLDYRGLVHRLMSVRLKQGRVIGYASHTERLSLFEPTVFLGLDRVPCVMYSPKTTFILSQGLSGR